MTASVTRRAGGRWRGGARRPAWRGVRIAAIAIGGVLASLGALPVADGGADAAQTGYRLELQDQALAFRPGDPLRFDYRLTGDVAALVTELGPTASRAGPTTSVAPVEDGTATPTGDPATEALPPPPPALVVQVTNYPALVDSSGLADVIGADVERTAFGDAIDGVELPVERTAIDVDDAGTATLEVVVDTDTAQSEADKLRFDEPGVHPVRVELLLADEAGGRTVLASAGTVVQRLPDDGRPTSPAVDLALVAAVEQLPSSATPAAVAATRGAVDDVVVSAAEIEPPIAAALPPDVLAHIAADGGRALLADALAGDELVSLPAAPLDVSAAAAVDRVDAFTRLLRAGEDMLTDAVPTTPTRRDLWIATEPLSAEGAQVLRDLGTRYVVMPADLYASTVGGPVPATDQFVQIALPDGGRLPLLVVDDVGAALTPGALPEGTTPTELAVATVAGVLLDSADDGRATDPAAQQTVAPSTARSRIVAAPRFGPLDPGLVEAVAAMADTTPDVRFAAASTLTGVTGVQQVDGRPLVVDLPPRAGPSLDARVARLEGAGLAMVSAGSMLPEDDPRRAEWANEIDSLISTAYSDDEVADQVDELLTEADRLKGAVVPPEPFTFTLTGRTGEIELPIGNELDEPLRVVLHLESPKLVFPDGDTEVLLDPETETRVVVPVRARANGTSSVGVHLRTPLGEDLTDTVRLTSRVNALTGIGQVLTGGLVVVLLTWWFTHWRSRRRQLAAASAQRHPSHSG